ncbi:MAG TPA: polysaccharide pyruvyl transferase family protein [Nocardioidaceae bacterium]|nr:polysaccharide pyruvyl transferase family protein [Nocardioidaceae bacterium]
MRRVLVTGWFSLDEAEVTAGDVLARDTAARWLTQSGIAHDVAVAENFRTDRDISLDDAVPDDYTDVVFVCGPAAGAPVEKLFARFPNARRLAVDVSVVDGTSALRLDGVLARDAPDIVRPDLSLATAAPGTPVVGVVLTHAQPEYGSNHRLQRAHELIGDALLDLDVAPVPLDTRLHPQDPLLCSTPGQLESALGRCDAVVTTRMHGLVLALKLGVPAVAVDPVAGGGKVIRQARVLDWPAAFGVEDADGARVAEALRWCLSAEGRSEATAVTDRLEDAVRDLRTEFVGFFAG